MKKGSITLGLALLLMIMNAGAGQESTDTGQNKDAGVSGPQWEYLVVAGGNVNLSATGSDRMRKAPDGSFSREAYPLERNLDKLGALGWELVSVTGSPNDPVFYLKRPK